MINQFEIAGIALQLSAGFLLILKQIDETWVENRGKSLRRLLMKLTGLVGTRRAIVILAILVVVPVLIAAMIIADENGQSNVELVLGAIFGPLLILGIYGNLLNGAIRLLRKWKPDRYPNYESAITVSNALLWVISLVLLISASFVSQASYGQDGPLWQKSLAFVYVFPVMLLGAPAYLLSSTYGVMWATLGLIQRLTRMSSTEVWAVIAVLWVAGGVLLLTNACIS